MRPAEPRRTATSHARAARRTIATREPIDAICKLSAPDGSAHVARELRIGARPREAHGVLGSREIATREAERDEVARGLLRDDTIRLGVAHDAAQERFGFDRTSEAVSVGLRRESPDLDAHEAGRERLGGAHELVDRARVRGERRVAPHALEHRVGHEVSLGVRAQHRRARLGARRA